jgi:hypothetical protein
MKNIMEFCRDVLKYKLIKNMGLIKVMSGEEVLEHSYEQYTLPVFLLLFFLFVCRVCRFNSQHRYFLYMKNLNYNYL